MTRTDLNFLRISCNCDAERWCLRKSFYSRISKNNYPINTGGLTPGSVSPVFLLHQEEAHVMKYNESPTLMIDGRIEWNNTEKILWSVLIWLSHLLLHTVVISWWDFQCQKQHQQQGTVVGERCSAGCGVVAGQQQSVWSSLRVSDQHPVSN